MLRVRQVGQSDTLRCHECGGAWWDLCGYTGCDERPFVELRGSIGHCLIVTTLCPRCVDGLIDELWPTTDTNRADLAGWREWEREKAPPRDPDPSLAVIAGILRLAHQP